METMNEIKSVKVSVLGAGTWGTALARMLANHGHEVSVWSALPAEIKSLKETHLHPNLPGTDLPESIEFIDDIEVACTGKDILVFAVPSIFVRSTAEKAAPYIKNGQVIVDVAKGIEATTLMTMTEIIDDVLKHAEPAIEAKLIALSGPTHAEEVAKDLPSTIVAAGKDLEAAKLVQKVFSNRVMRVYTNDDIKGVEICGALKNIIALASGISNGLGYGDNLRAAIITRGLAEITRLGLAMGCKEQTFAGLAGIGDLIVTATSRHSRNNNAGFYIGSGMSAEEATKKVGMVVEGINALPAAMKLAETYQVSMPLSEAVNEVVFNHASAQETFYTLMDRNYKAE